MHPNSAILLIVRRMRAPLIVLILIYAVSVLGLTLIPGVDANGKPWQMGFCHAFYFLSYTATTIGFGEIPYAFTDAQRICITSFSPKAVGRVDRRNSTSLPLFTQS